MSARIFTMAFVVLTLMFANWTMAASFAVKNESKGAIQVWICEKGKTKYNSPPTKISKGATKSVYVGTTWPCYMVVRDGEGKDHHIGRIRQDDGFRGTPSLEFDAEFVVTYRSVFRTYQIRDPQTGELRTIRTENKVWNTQHQDRSKSQGLKIEPPRR